MSRFLFHAEAMYPLHRSPESLPSYEDILEITYRKFISSGDTVIDVGAHSGRHSAVFADLVGEGGHVHAFEPLPIAREWMAARGMPVHVTVYPVALSPHRGTVTFHYCAERPEESGLKERELVGESRMEEITVDSMPLDDFVDQIDRVSFMKLDAEGGEIGCLRSGRELILRDRPLIAVEYGRPGYSAFGLTKQSLFDVAVDYGYLIGDLFGGICESRDDWEVVCDLCYWDWYLVPEERSEAWAAALRVV